MPSLNENPPTRWHTFATSAALQQAAAKAILHAARQAIEIRGRFQIVLAGGNTPLKIYDLLRRQNVDAAAAAWGGWHVFFGDERCLPPDDTDRNSHMAAMMWLDHVPIPRNQIHPIRTELGAEAAATDYAQTLERIDLFDLVLLGLGEDGHTASLFPGRTGGATSHSPVVIAIHDSPKLPRDRVSLSVRRLSAARQVMFLVTGESKRQAVSNWRHGAEIPAAAIKPSNGVDIYVEAALLKDENG